MLKNVSAARLVVALSLCLVGSLGCENFSSKPSKDAGSSDGPGDAVRGSGTGGVAGHTTGTGGSGDTGGQTGTGGQPGTGGQTGTGGQPGTGGDSGGSTDGGAGGVSGPADAGSGGASPDANPRECTPAAKQCNGLQPQVCGATGAWENAGSRCPFVCSASTGACSGSCTPGSKQCDRLQPQVCDPNGAWQSMGAACANVCNGGTCAACSPGQMQCNGLQPQTCDANGVWKDMGTRCPFVCNNATGACTGSCVPGATQCSGTQPQVCDAMGAWVNKGTACGGCTTCSAAMAVCIVATGMACSDNNACTTGETCQSNGSCGGGTAVTCPGADQCRTVGACVPTTGCPAPVVKTGMMCMAAVSDPCVITTCQANGTCGGGTPAPKNTPCGNNRFCDGNRMCKCRQPSAGNMLANPGFDESASPWSLFRASYSEIDADGCMGSGSINTSGSGASVFQCVPVTPSTRYYFYYKFRTSSGSGQAACSLRFYGNGSCTSDVQGTLFSHNAIAPEGAWAQGRLEAVSDSNASHVYISCAAGTSAGFYDQFYLGTASIPSSMPAF